MAPEKTEADPSDVNNDAAVNTSTVSVDSILSDTDHDPYFEPVVSLPIVQVKTNEEDEEEILKLRCKLFRYHVGDDGPAFWKERGIGDVKILKRSEEKMLSFHHSMFEGYDDDETAERDGDYYNLPVQETRVRLLMRQDKTLKVRANHYITPYMELKPNCGSDRAWVWSAMFDFADEEPKKELFAVKFANAEHARLFKEKFDEGKGLVTSSQMKAKEGTKNAPSTISTESENETAKSDETSSETKPETETSEVTKELESLTVKDTEQKDNDTVCDVSTQQEKQ